MLPSPSSLVRICITLRRFLLGRYRVFHGIKLEPLPGKNQSRKHRQKRYKHARNAFESEMSFAKQRKHLRKPGSERRQEEQAGINDRKLAEEDADHNHGEQAYQSKADCSARGSGAWHDRQSSHNPGQRRGQAQPHLSIVDRAGKHHGNTGPQADQGQNQGRRPAGEPICQTCKGEPNSDIEPLPTPIRMVRGHLER